MPILPIDTERYGTKEMLFIFEEKNYIQKLLDVESALAWAHGQVGNIPKKDAEKIVQMANTNFVSLRRIKKIESEIKHDIMAMVRAFAEVCGSSGALIHLGATSYDIVDTAKALQLKEAINLIEGKLNSLELILIKLVEKYKKTLMIGRTHGQHALPITFGLKLSVWMREVSRHIQRIIECKKRVIVGKISGAVGTQASLGVKGHRIQELVMRKLGIKSALVTTQIIQRDRHAELICVLAIITSTLDKIATEIRELQRTEIGEVFEPFEKKKQVGSSTMPNKRNPELCEKICGLAKIMRSLVNPALENIITWNERDLTQSSSERFILPEACIISDYMLFLITKVLQNIKVDEIKMLNNMKLTGGLIMSERIMIELTKKGMDRQKAHELIRDLAMKSIYEKKSFETLILKSDEIKQYSTVDEIKNLLDPKYYLGNTKSILENALKVTIKEREKRNLHNFEN